MVNESIDRGGGSHGVLEDAVPLAKDEIARDDGPTLVPFGHEREDHLNLVRALLQIADVVEDDDLEAVELAQSTRQREVASSSCTSWKVGANSTE